MNEILIRLLFPGTPAAPGGTAMSLGHEGIAWSTAGLGFFLLTALVAYSYWRSAQKSPRYVRIGLAVLRLILLGLLLVLLVRPVLIIPQKETTRRPLLVLLDTSRSMTIADLRKSPEDEARAALAAGLIDPAAGVNQPLPPGPRQPSRAALLTSLAENPRLNLWPRLQAQADLLFHGFGPQVSELGALKAASENAPLSLAEGAAFFRKVTYEGDGTALGDALRNVLAKTSEPVAGLLVITDGANNAGSSPLDAARAVLAADVPFFIYGVGVALPPDVMVTEIVAPETVPVKERIHVVVRFRSQGMSGRSSQLRLMLDDEVIAEEPVNFLTDGEQEWQFSFIPETGGPRELKASIVPLPQESVPTNNARSTSVLVKDEKINVLLIQREPNWDFQYLLAFLQRDRRVNVRCVLLRGDPGLAELPKSPFLPQLPGDRAGLLGQDVVILGDVSPSDLGEARMKLLYEGVNRLGSGLVLLSGPHLNPLAYAGTPLEPLLPVTVGDAVPTAPGQAGFRLSLTPAGQATPWLRTAPDASTSTAIWAAFPEVRWITPAGSARPGAQILLAGPASTRAGEPAPVALAYQRLGAGQVLYFGFGETHLWRARTGENSYARIWLQILNALSARRDSGTTAYSQLKIERTEYLSGEKIRLTARALNPDFTPVAAKDLPVNLRPASASKVDPPTLLRLAPLPGRPGEFSGEFTAPPEGAYVASLESDAGAVVAFRVKVPMIEMGDISLRERSLRAMAEAGGGHFLREEDLTRLPEWISARNVPVIIYRKVPLTLAPALLAFMIFAACLEWFWRRKIDLK